jgi:hypothetical protein
MKAYQNYFLYLIANSTIRYYPWTHVLFENIFNSDHYDMLLKNLPDESCLIDITKVKKHPADYPKNRLILDDYNDLPNNQREFWEAQRDTFLDGKLKNILLNKFWPLLIDRIGQEYVNEVEFYDTFQLTKDKKGYVLEAHPDAFNKIFTIVINLPNNNFNANMGTVVYNDNKELVYTSKYLPNTGFGVFRSDNSWHGVEETNEDRWTIQYTIWGKDKY